MITFTAYELKGDNRTDYYFREFGVHDDLVMLGGNLNRRISKALSKRFIIKSKGGVSKWTMLTREKGE